MLQFPTGAAPVSLQTIPTLLVLYLANMSKKIIVEITKMALVRGHGQNTHVRIRQVSAFFWCLETQLVVLIKRLDC